MGLSQRRATAVKDDLVKQGAADAQRITTVGYGETRPIASNATPEGRTQNRRADTPYPVRSRPSSHTVTYRT